VVQVALGMKRSEHVQRQTDHVVTTEWNEDMMAASGTPVTRNYQNERVQNLKLNSCSFGQSDYMISEAWT
jgi:hypothetical protein